MGACCQELTGPLGPRQAGLMHTSCVTARGAQDGIPWMLRDSGQQPVSGTILIACEVDYAIPFTQMRKLRLRGNPAAGSSLRPEPPKPTAVSPFRMCLHSSCAPATEEEARGWDGYWAWQEMGADLRKIREISFCCCCLQVMRFAGITELLSF